MPVQPGALRFWLALRLPTGRSIGISMPTIPRSIVSMKSGGASVNFTALSLTG